MKWLVEFFEFDLLYEPRGPIKGLVLTKILVELTVFTISGGVEDCKWILSVDEI